MTNQPSPTATDAPERQPWLVQLRTVPNMLSALRLILVPVFLFMLLNNQGLVAIAILAVSSITDFLDGYLARRYHQVTRLGQLLDPFADRLYIFSTLIAFSIQGVIPWWLALLVLGRDFMLLVVYPILATHGYGPLPVHYLGKAGTMALLYAFPLLLIANIWADAALVVKPLAWAFALWGVGLYWWAGFVYVKQVADVVKTAKTASGSGLN